MADDLHALVSWMVAATHSPDGTIPESVPKMYPQVGDILELRKQLDAERQAREAAEGKVAGLLVIMKEACTATFGTCWCGQHERTHQVKLRFGNPADSLALSRAHDAQVFENGRRQGWKEAGMLAGMWAQEDWRETPATTALTRFAERVKEWLVNKTGGALGAAAGGDMSPFSQLLLHCPVCKAEYDWMHGYSREIRCCSRECYEEAEWRRTLAILGKAYYPKPRREEKPA